MALLAKIQSLLDAPSLSTNLSRLFGEVLGWDAASGSPWSITFGTAVAPPLTVYPVAHIRDFPVFRIDWPAGTLPTVAESRAVYRALMPTAGEHLVCYVTPDGRSVAFVWAKQVGRSKIALRTLRYEAQQPTMSIAERLVKLAFTEHEKESFGDSGMPIVLGKLEAAFDVAAVTKQFLSEYRRVFKLAEDALTMLPQPSRRLFALKLFSRLMVILFLERKGWFTLHGRTDYLLALWQVHAAERERGNDPRSFYQSRLNPLFFGSLAAREKVAGRSIDPNNWIGQLPHLGGQLFAQDDVDRDQSICIPDAVLEQAITSLFYRFNCTLSESTLLDAEVAVDPEMLGTMFEALVAGRRESGSYYTPKPLVVFMCREALKGYLQTQVPDEAASALARFVDEHDAGGLRNASAVLEALRTVTVCDPACGSGALLLGMLQELAALRSVLSASHAVDTQSMYERKREIIERNLCGMDLDPFAVTIAQLRLWLSLVEEFKHSYATPRSLRGVRCMITAGDGLIAADQMADTPHTSFHRQPVKEPSEPTDVSLKLLKSPPGELRSRFKLPSGSSVACAAEGEHAGLDNRPIEPFPMFDAGSFDIVVANPPYVRQERLSRVYKERWLKPAYPTVYSGTADLYVYFYVRALQILRVNGTLAIISPNKWLRARYGAKLREQIAANCRITSITDFGDLPVFETALTYPMICVAQKGKGAAGPTIVTQVQSLAAPYPDVQALIQAQGQRVPATAVMGADWTLASGASMQVLPKKRAGLPLIKYVQGNLYRGVLTGLNRAFFIDASTRSALIAADPKSAEVIMPLALGKDIRRWRVAARDRWLIFTRRGTDIDRYPAIRAYLEQWQQQLTPKVAGNEANGRKPGRYSWYEIQDEITYHACFGQPKIVYQVFQVKPSFAYDQAGMFVNNAVYIIPTTDLYLLGVLNSQACWHEIGQRCSHIQNGYQLMRANFANVFIPHAAAPDRAAIAGIVQQCIESQGDALALADCEAEIDARVASLYGLPTAQGRMVI